MLKCLRCGGGARNPVCAKCRRIVGDVHSHEELVRATEELAVRAADAAALATDVEFVRVAKRQRHPVAALVSLCIPGLGQVLKGNIVTAVFIWLVMATCLVLFFIGGLPMFFIVWGLQVFQAYGDPDLRTKMRLAEIRDRRC